MNLGRKLPITLVAVGMERMQLARHAAPEAKLVKVGGRVRAGSYSRA
jgi:hypothetical protein